MTTVQTSLQTQDLITVGQSWTQANRSQFLLSAVPQVLVRGPREGVKAVTYQLPDLANALVDGNALSAWEVGDALPLSRKLTSSTVTVTPEGYSTPIINRPLYRNTAHAFADLETNIAPMCLSMLHQGVDQALLAFLQGTGNFGSAKTFTNGGSALDAPSDYTNQKPDIDINTNLQPLRKWRGLGLKLECWMDRHVVLVLARHPVYTGAGTGSAIASQLEPDEFVARFKAIHMLDDVKILDPVYNTAKIGQTNAIKDIHNGLLWFGAVDRRGTMDLRRDGSPDAPDGAIQLAFAREPEVVTWADVATECEYFAGRTSYKIINPRGTSFGHFYTASGAGGIFTTLPS